RALSGMRVPSYIGEVICTAVNPGTLPPHIIAMKALPSDMHDAWSVEVNFEYLGGMVLEIETRLEIQELEHQNENSSFIDSNSARLVTSDLLESFENYGKQLTGSEERIDETKKDEEELPDYSVESEKKVRSAAPASSSSSSSHGSKWKSIVNSVTKQVSQVPLTMGIRISSLTGTVQFRMKAPPSDQVWYGFAAMPDIQFDVETWVGDRRITSGRVAQLMINRLKAAVRDAFVIPHMESITVPWMSAEKDDWIPRAVAPFVWCRGSQQQDSAAEMPKQPEPAAANSTPDVGNSIGPASSPLQELSVPLLPPPPSKDDDGGDVEEDEEWRQRRMGTRERMRGLGKKMGEKLETKRRHIEEKGRSLVEKMRGGGGGGQQP
ncbi:hypothetical protein M569_04055, partial [Genlisea aurea]